MRVKIVLSQSCVACKRCLPSGGTFEGDYVYGCWQYLCDACNAARKRTGCDTPYTIEAILYRQELPNDFNRDLTFDQKNVLGELGLLAERDEL